ncbi:MFS transporter [Streptomyces sp. NPDC050315]|uniref:MFS transporter n=1 Tax=Streptomyces sp. NPDC050315 TaxID=3155039 RepID=UPI00341F4D72
MSAASPRPAALRYAVGALATGTFGTVPGLLLLYYLTDTLDVPAAVASIVIVLPKAWDLVLHPWVGRRSDPAKGRSASRRTWMVAGGGALSFTFALLFMAPTPLGIASAAWTGAAFFLCATAYSAFQVPYLAVLAEIAHDPAERVKLATWRTVLYGVAILLAGSAAPQLAHTASDERLGYALVGVVFGALLLIGTLAAAFSAPPAPSRPVGSGAHGMTFRQQVRVARESQAFRRLLGVHVAQTLATGIMLASAQYFATYQLQNPKATTPLFACLIVPLLLTAPLWQAMTRRSGHRNALVISIILFVLGASALVTTPLVPRIAAYAFVAVCGVGYAGMQTVAIALLGDTVAEDARLGGHNRGGAFTGLWTAGEVIGAGAGPALFSLLLSATGFLPSSAGAPATQPESALIGVLLGVSVLPALVLLPALWCAWRLRRPSTPAEQPPVSAKTTLPLQSS